MSDYEKECFMVQGFSSSSAATPGSTHSEYVQEAQQGKILYHDYHRAVIFFFLKILKKGDSLGVQS